MYRKKTEMIKLAGAKRITYNTNINARQLFNRGILMLTRSTFLLLNLLGISLLGMSLSLAAWADDGFSAPPTKQSFYKWIDGKGVTHYSATPPSPKEVAKKIKKVQTDLPVKKTTASAPTTPTTQTPTVTSPTEPPKPLTTPVNARPDLNAERDQSCQAAQKNLQSLQNHARIYQKNEKGERHFLTDKEMEEQVKTTQQFLKDNC